MKKSKIVFLGTMWVPQMKNKKGAMIINHKPLIFMARPEGFEPPACGFEVQKIAYSLMGTTA